MFESVTLTGQESGATCIDLGLLAETLVLYQRVHLIVDDHALKFLIRACGAETVLALLELDVLELNYFENRTAVGQAVRDERMEGYGLILANPIEMELYRFLPPFLEELFGRQGKARRVANRFYKRIKTSQYTQDDLDLDLGYLITGVNLERSLGSLISIISPGYRMRPGAFFRIELLSQEQRVVRVETNLDFRAIEAGLAGWLRPSLIPGTMDPRGVIAILLAAANDLRFASNANTEVAPGPVQSVLLPDIVENAVRNVAHTGPSGGVYEECSLPHVRSIRDAVNSGKRNFADVLRLVEQSQGLKEWLKGKPQGRDLLKEYLNEFERLPTTEHLDKKAFRFL
jgi:hypothetical protein